MRVWTYMCGCLSHMYMYIYIYRYMIIFYSTLLYYMILKSYYIVSYHIISYMYLLYGMFYYMYIHIHRYSVYFHYRMDYHETNNNATWPKRTICFDNSLCKPLSKRFEESDPSADHHRPKFESQIYRLMASADSTGNICHIWDHHMSSCHFAGLQKEVKKKRTTNNFWFNNPSSDWCA